AAGALLHGAAHDDVVDLRGLDAGPLHRGADRVRGQRRRFEVVERAPVGLADRGAGRRDDHGFFHGDGSEKRSRGGGPYRSGPRAFAACSRNLSVCSLPAASSRGAPSAMRSQAAATCSACRADGGRNTPGVSPITTLAKPPAPAATTWRVGASSLARNTTAGVTASGASSASACSGRRPAVMRVAAIGATALTRMPYFAPSAARQFMNPTSAIFAAP